MAERSHEGRRRGQAHAHHHRVGVHTQLGGRLQRHRRQQDDRGCPVERLAEHTGQEDQGDENGIVSQRAENSYDLVHHQVGGAGCLHGETHGKDGRHQEDRPPFDSPVGLLHRDRAEEEHQAGGDEGRHMDRLYAEHHQPDHQQQCSQSQRRFVVPSGTEAFGRQDHEVRIGAEQANPLPGTLDQESIAKLETEVRQTGADRPPVSPDRQQLETVTIAELQVAHRLSHRRRSGSQRHLDNPVVLGLKFGNIHLQVHPDVADPHQVLHPRRVAGDQQPVALLYHILGRCDHADDPVMDDCAHGHSEQLAQTAALHRRTHQRRPGGDPHHREVILDGLQRGEPKVRHPEVPIALHLVQLASGAQPDDPVSRLQDLRCESSPDSLASAIDPYDHHLVALQEPGFPEALPY